MRQPAAPDRMLTAVVTLPDDAWPDRFARVHEGFLGTPIDPLEPHIAGCEWSVFSEHPPFLERSRPWSFVSFSSADDEAGAPAGDEVVALPCLGPYRQGCLHRTTEAEAFLAAQGWSDASELLALPPGRLVPGHESEFL